jgi:hypothetical protein
MKRFVLTFLMTYLFVGAFAHEGEEHGKKAAAPTGATYFSSEALSDKYEVLVKYGELEAGKESTLQLFLSNAATNRAIDSATITLKVMNQPALKLVLSRIDSGVYALKGTFPANQPYDLQVAINSSLGPDFLQVPRIEVGKKLQAAPEEEHSHWYDNPVLWATAGLLLGLLAMYFIMRSRYRKLLLPLLLWLY